MIHKSISIQNAFSALQQGHEEGLTYFFELYYTPLLWFATRILGNETIAEDVVADAFVKLWSKKETLTLGKAVKSYLYSTVRNTAIDYLRRQKLSAVHKKEVIYLNDVQESTVIARIIETETYHRLYQSLQTLPPQAGKILQLFINGKSYKEIAQEMGLSEKTIRNQRVRAVKLLRQHFTPLLTFIFLISTYV